MASAAYPLWLDLAWLAVDDAGRVAAFITGGEGPIPVNLFEPDGLTEDDVEPRILSLPRVSLVRTVRNSGGSNSFTAIAERGLFVYDWTDVHRTRPRKLHAYELVGVPTQPIKLADLPLELAAIAALNAIRIPDFATAIVLDVCQSVRCLTSR